MSLSDQNRATFERVFADDLPYTDRDGMIISEAWLSRLMEAVRDEERERQERMRLEEKAERAAARAEGRPSPEPRHPMFTDPMAWWAETGTAGSGEGCNRPFWLRHEAVEYVRQHGGYVKPLHAPAGEVTPGEPGGFVGDIFYGDPVHTTRGTHRWNGSAWCLLPSEVEVLTEMLSEARAQIAALSTPSPEAGREEASAWRSVVDIDHLESTVRMCEEGRGHNPGVCAVSTEVFRAMLDGCREALSPPAPEPDLFAGNAKKPEPGYEAEPVANSLEAQLAERLADPEWLAKWNATEDERRPFESMLHMLRADEGSSVTLLCDNPDLNGQPNNAVECCGEWTDWLERRFTGDTIRAAVLAAYKARYPAEHSLSVGSAASPVPVAISREELEQEISEAVLSASVEVPDDFGDRVAMRRTITKNTADAILQRLSNQQGGGKGSLPELPCGVRPSDDTDPQAHHSDGEGA